MDFLTADYLIKLLNIILIDLVLAGDNAIVIALAARNLPRQHQKKAIIWGTVGAVVIRIAATVAVVWLLQLPFLLLIGGILLVWIAYKLLVDEKDHNIEAKPQLWPAIRTIIIADAVMGFDNVIAVAGAAHGSFDLVVIGLIISVPIMVWGSTLFIRLVERFPVIITIGAAVLAYTAGSMLTSDPFVKGWFEENPVMKWTIISVVVIGVVLGGYLKKMSKNFISINEQGQLTIPESIEKEAHIQANDSFEAKVDDKGRIVLVKVAKSEG
ncbi:MULTISPECIES: TerC family protein [unclassified Paenibacillus]|uniref:TerC family protein n=1 Tax=unclassified Paenibacillus TaxID=185978 RepID=UPI001AE82FD5|nr:MULTISPECIES: TerC family protein [unclassified Paenibacillus]MBP1154742.1 YjbE family integral membrane protein [Paenibacillus sp. PvP091]MBP1169874.1 YjbE family integral membrane protein [Paenibacillus sp. PvR098]MBP2440902.1 YjbE family integral membrane protein [Paenibacillus sp. PvP052]